MDYVVGLISLVSLGLNYLLYRRITATYPVPSVETFDLDPIEAHDCCQVILERLDSESQPKEAPKPPETKNPEVYSAWVNRSGIPMVPQTKPPEPIIKTPNRGPLARPDGFV